MRKSWLVSGLAAVVGVSVGVVGTQLVSGAGSSQETVFVPVTPCRLVDTRPAETVGPVSIPIGADTQEKFNAHDGKDSGSACAIPSTATAISANVVAVSPTANGYLATYPGDESNPGTATLNFVAGQAPTPNAAIIPLAGDGSFYVFNKFGEVNVVMDINGYYQPSTNVGAQGPAGPTGTTFIGQYAFTLTTSTDASYTKPNGYYATETLQPGKYFVTGTYTLYNSDVTNETRASCYFILDGSEVGTRIDDVVLPQDSSTVPFAQTFDITTTTSATTDFGLVCATFSGSAVYDWGNMTLLKIN